MPLLSQRTKSWLTIRNDDIYSFRWANNAFARQFIKDIPQTEKIAGFYMGPDGYTWGRDYLTKGSEHQLVMQKQWYSFMLWGRLSYNPDLPEDVFMNTLQTRFPDRACSDPVPPLVCGFHDLSLDHPLRMGRYRPEMVSGGQYQSPGAQRLLHRCGLYRTRTDAGQPDQEYLPLGTIQSPGPAGFAAIAHGSGRYTLHAFWDSSFRLKKITCTKPGSFTELDQTLGDIEAFAHIGNYYAAKMKAACSLALFDQYGNEADRRKAIGYLQKARVHWIKYSVVYASLYKAALYNRVGVVNIPQLLQKVEADITTAKQWKQGTVKYQPKNTTEAPFRK